MKQQHDAASPETGTNNYHAAARDSFGHEYGDSGSVSYARASSDQVTLTDTRMLELADGFGNSNRFLDALVGSGVSTPAVQRAREALSSAFCEAVVRNRVCGESVHQG